MKNLSHWLYETATWKKVTIFAVTTLFFIFLLFPSLSTIFSSTDTPLQMLDSSFNYTPEEAIEHINIYTAEERAGYIKISLIADLIYPFIYSFTFALLLSLLFRSMQESKSLIQYINLFPLFALVSDLIENLTLILLINSYPNYSFVLAQIAAIATPMKWGFLTTIIMIAAYRVSYNRGQQRRIQKRN